MMKRFSSLFVIAMVILILSPSTADANDGQISNWMMYFGNYKIADRMNLHAESQLRSYNFVGDMNQLLLRTGVGYDLSSNNNNLLMGYGYIKTTPYIDQTELKLTINEHRVFQQYIHKHQFGRASVFHRKRIEERFIDDDFSMRFRYFIGLHLPLNNSEMEVNTLYLSAFNEVFLKTTEHAFDRDRMYGALGMVLHKNLRTEVGVMRQVIGKQAAHHLQISVFNALPFHNPSRRQLDVVAGLMGD